LAGKQFARLDHEKEACSSRHKTQALILLLSLLLWKFILNVMVELNVFVLFVDRITVGDENTHY